MSRIDFTEKSVIDFGTGTGVLSILAEKLGAESVLGIDYDKWSIENSLENAMVNKCIRTTFLKAETIPHEFKADIILANINLNVIIQNIKEIKNAGNKNANYLFSGILNSDEDKLTEVLKESGILVQEIFRNENWSSILANSN